MSAVYSQFQTQEEEISGHKALFSCPTNSIGNTSKPSENSKFVLQNIPWKISDNVYHLGFHSEKSFGAASYFIKNDQGNIMVDSPRFVKKLALNLRKMGGVAIHWLSHKDDIADADQYHKEFNSQRFIHNDDQTKSSKHFENFFEGAEPVEFGPDLLNIPVPGHTKGSCVLLYKNKYLFTGDHLAWSRDRGQLIAFRNACWYDFKIQIQSMERLLDYSFESILPGHGAPFCGTKEETKKELVKCIQWMKENI